MKKVTLLLFVLTTCSALTVLQAQNVGIGTTTPTYPLTVQGSVSTGKAVTAKNGPIEVGFYNDSTYAYVQTWTPHDLYFTTNNGGPKICILNATGAVGINTGTPTAQLDVNGTLRIRSNGAVVGNVLTSDASGNATWQAPAAPTRNDVYSVGSLDFKPVYNTDPINNGNGQGGAYYTTATSARLQSPVHLPNGAKVTQITYGFYDNTAQDFAFEFGTEYNSNSGYGTSYNSVSSGASAGWRTVTYTPTTPITINNNTFSYYVSASTSWPGTFNMAIKSVVVQYSY